SIRRDGPRPDDQPRIRGRHAWPAHRREHRRQRLGVHAATTARQARNRSHGSSGAPRGGAATIMMDSIALESIPLRRRSPCTVLIVEDDDGTRLAERLVLESFGFFVREASSGLDALALAQVSRPRIVLLDIILPEIDGRQLARMLRADPSTRHAALLAVSALSGPEERERAITAGCDEFISKPVPPLHLVRMVRLYARRDERLHHGAYDFDPL